jgi:hypothetical protein
MPRHGDSTGLIHFNEIIGSHPVVWDDEPTKKYFDVPTLPTQQAPVFTYTKPGKPKHVGRYFDVPAQATKRNVYFDVPSRNGGK